MKKLHELTLGAAMSLFALTACNDEAMMPDVPQADELHNPEVCVLSADDFRWEGTESRTSISIEDETVKFLWTAGDLVGILPDQGAQVYFTIPEPEEGEAMSNEASFDGGAWSLRAQNNYAAYYPFVKDFDLVRTEIPVDYTGQKQTGTTYTHIGAYDYMGARPVTTNSQGAGVTFDFDHVGALVRLQFTVPTAGTRLKSVTLSADGVKFTTKGTYSLASSTTEGFPITATATSPKMAVELDYTTTEDNEVVPVYMMCAPVDLSDKTVNISVDCSGNSTLEYTAAGKKLEAATAYGLTASGEPNVVKTAMMVTDGTELSANISSVLGNATKLRFVTQSDKTSDNVVCTDGNDVKAYAVLNGDWLEVHTEAKEFKLSGSCNYMFDSGLSSLEALDMSGFNTSEVTDMSLMFYGCSALTSLDLSSFDTRKVTDMSYMFFCCSSLTSLDLSSFDTQKVTDMNNMFNNCSALTSLDLSSFDTQNVTDMNNMFYFCSELSIIKFGDNFNTSSVTDMNYMFLCCSSLTSLDLSGFDTQNVTDMNNMFYNCSSLTSLDLSGFDTQNVTNMSYMFYDCSSLTSLDLSGFTFSDGDNCDYMLGKVGTNHAKNDENSGELLETDKISITVTQAGYDYLNSYQGTTGIENSNAKLVVKTETSGDSES